MRIRGVNRLKRAVRRVRKTIAPGALILMYHRVVEAETDPWSLCVTPQRFAEHLEILRQLTHPVALTTLNQGIQDKKRLPRHVVVTFDDGYVDNLRYAKPLLEKYEIPATIFITSGYLGENREFWWDELEQILLYPNQLPKTWTLTIAGTEHSWDLGDFATYTHEDLARNRGWSAGDEHHPTPRHTLYIKLHSLLRPLSNSDRDPIIEELRRLANIDQLQVRPSYRPLTPDEVKTLDAGDWVKVGAHSTTHPLLATLSVDQQQKEIQHSKTYLETLLNRPITTFAYPYGNYSSETPDLVKDLGFVCACSTKKGDVRPSDDRFQLHRIGVCNWTGEEFAHQINQWI